MKTFINPITLTKDLEQHPVVNLTVELHFEQSSIISVIWGLTKTRSIRVGWRLFPFTESGELRAKANFRKTCVFAKNYADKHDIPYRSSIHNRSIIKAYEDKH